MVRPALAAAAALLLSLAGCSGPPPRAANPTKPVPERRAIEVIARAVRKARFTPVEGRDIAVQTGGTLHVDVLVEEHKWGIVFLTSGDEDATKSAPQKDAKRPSALVVVEGSVKSNATGMKILVLFERDYLYDDQVGEDHEQTMITAEGAIGRDVTDFLVQAKAQGWE